MRMSIRGLALALALGIPVPLPAQGTPAETPSRAQIVAAAKAIIQETRYCTLVTLGPDGQPQARVVDPFPPDSDLTIWIATNPLTRKVQDIQRDPRVTLLCFNPGTFEYVAILGKAVPDTEAGHKAAHWKESWAALYKNQNHGDDYLLLRMTPFRLEVVSARRGLSNDSKTWRPVILDLAR